MSTATITLDLNKIQQRKELVLDLTKEAGIKNFKAQVVLVLDYSGSMGSMYYDNRVQTLLERILPIGLGFDDNGEVDFYLFHDDVIKLPQPLTLQNTAGYIDTRVMKKYSMGGTNYAPVIKEVVKTFTKKSFFGGNKPLSMPVLVLFITDGNNNDHHQTEQAMREASNYGIFWKFIGISETGNKNFPFLENLDNLTGRKIDNAHYFKADNITNMSDVDLYSNILVEVKGWLADAKKEGMIV